MKKFLIAMALVLTSCQTLEQGGFVQNAQGVLNQVLLSKGPVTTTEIALGLKDALKKGISVGSNQASKVDGFYRNPSIKIPFPPEAAKAEQLMRKFGLNKLANNVTLSLNRAAEEAAKESLQIFLGAIAKLTIRDALKILQGPPNAATEFLRLNTSEDLRRAFSPIVSRALNQVGATKLWNRAAREYNRLPLVKPLNLDLKSYVTEKTLSGLFVLIAKEEFSVRKDPSARTTQLLRRVFGDK